MTFFTEDFNAFFKDLAKNNHKEWFNAHKKRYEMSVKLPFEAFISEMLRRIQKEDPRVNIEAKEAILRINRDIRFAKDKTPYNLHQTAFLSAGGRKHKEIPGFFLRLSPEMVGIMAGAYHPSNEELQKIRYNITNNDFEITEILNNKSFKEKYTTLKGEQSKRIPSEFKAAAIKQPLVANKQFYVMAELSPDLITADDLADQLMTYYHAAKPLNDFLINVMK
ncbi:MAG: DUF2461 domain-containing protein [Saprospiraceae bacterium]